jgi:hypothetical protein
MSSCGGCRRASIRRSSRRACGRRPPSGSDLLERNKVAVGRAKDLLDIEAIAEIRKRR